MAGPDSLKQVLPQVPVRDQLLPEAVERLPVDPGEPGVSRGHLELGSTSAAKV